jgi:sarcosine oxidase, subunit gamma
LTMIKSPAHSASISRVQTWDSTASVPLDVERALDVAWPTEVGTVTCASAADILCTGPTDWLVIATNEDLPGLREQLAAAFQGNPFRATDVSIALARIEINGPDSRDVLAKGCSLDLHPSRFPPGRCARTRFAAMPVVVRCTQANEFDCIVARSYRDYLLSWLEDAALEFSKGPS